MKKLFFLLIFTCLANFLQAQSISFQTTKSDIFKDEFKNSVIVLSEINPKKELLLVRSYNGSNVLSQGQGFYIEKYDENLKVKSAFDFEMKHPNYQKYNLMIGVFTMSGNLHFVEIYYDINEKAFTCFDNIMSEDYKITTKELFRLTREEMGHFGNFNLQQKFYARAKETWTNDNSGAINSENELAQLNNFHKVFFAGNGGQSYQYSAVYENENQGPSSDILLTVNENKTSFAIAIDGNNKENDGLKLFLFDSSLNKKLDLFFTTEIKDKKCFFENIQTSPNEDAIYLLAKAYTKDLKKKDEGGKYYYEFAKITPQKTTRQKIDVGEHFIGSLKTYFHNNELVTIGFYSDAKDFTYSGICCFKSDANSLEIKSSKYNPFSEQFLTDKYGYENNKALKNIRFKKLFFTNNNEIILNAEESYITEQYYKSYGAPTSISPFGNSTAGGASVHYNYDDIIIAKLTADGNLLWARNINKRQSSADDDNSFISYTSTIVNDKNYLFINTKDKIKKLKNDRIEFGQVRKNKSNLNVIEVNTVGDFNYQEILDDEENKVPFMVSKGTIIDNSVYFLGRRTSNKQLLKVTL
jgi:hypothetical protein